MQPTPTTPRTSSIVILWGTILFVAVTWTVTVVIILQWELQHARKAFNDVIQLRGEMLYQNVRSIQHWIGVHGGIYVATDEPDHESGAAPSDPSQRKLVFLTPTEFLRNIYDEFQAINGTRVRLVGENPINPANTPDGWEMTGLTALHSGATDFIREAGDANDHSYRLLRPIVLRDKCLACHDNFNAEDVGTIAGAVSINLDLTQDRSAHDSTTAAMRVHHTWLWAFGMAIIGAIAVGWRRILSRLNDLITRDPLTHIMNRRTLMDCLDREVARNLRDRRGVGVMMLDIDHFKKVNDTFGHQAGDEVLRRVSQLLADQMRPFDVVGRYGGEEFMIICPNSDLADTAAIAERLRSAIASRRFDTARGPIGVTASIGVAGTELVADPDDLVGAADGALYKAKGRGRNCVCVAPAPPPGRAVRPRPATALAPSPAQ